MAVPFGRGWDRAREEFYVPRDTSTPASEQAEDGFWSDASLAWDRDQARRALRQQVLDHLASPEGVLVVLEAEFVKDSGSYVGSYRHVEGPLGRAEHRQRGVFLAYACPRGEGYMDRDLFLPRSWTEREALRVAAGMPADVSFSTCSQMARRMLERVLDARVPHASITGGPTFGSDAGLRMWLEQRGEPYVLGVPGREVVRVGRSALRADTVAALWPEEAWRPPKTPGAVERGEQLAGIVLDGPADTQWQRWLVAERHSWARDDVEYYVAYARNGTTLDSIHSVIEAHRRAHQALREARQSVGLDRFSGRSWQSWYRHMTIALMAYTMKNMLRHRAAAH